METRSRSWRRLALGPLILIGLGILLLLTNLGYVPRETWRTLWQFWPVLLILLGAQLLLTGRASWGAFLVAFLLLLVLGAASGSTGIFARRGQQAQQPAVPATSGSRFEQTLDNARAAEVKLSHGAGRLTLTAGTRTGVLTEGLIEGDARAGLAKSYRVNDGVGFLDLSQERGQGLGQLFRGGDAVNTLDLRLTREVPLRRLELDGGAADVLLDLRELQVQRLDLNAGGSSVLVRLPTRGAVSATMNTGASSLVVEIPTELAADIRVDGGLSGLTIDEGRFPSVRSEGVPSLAFQREYRSPSYDTAQNRVDLRISAGVASIEIR